MLIIGEKINSTRKSIDRAVKERDREAIVKEALRQVEAGAGMLDVNCGTLPMDQEPAAMTWLVRTVQEATDVPLCIDSPNPAALAAGLAAHQGKAMVNSISGESKRMEQVLPLVLNYGASVVALCMDDTGIPAEKNKAVELGDRLVRTLVDRGVGVEDIYFDPLVRSLATNTVSVLDTLFVMREMSQRFKGLHVVSGLSNVSYGLPERKHLNRAYVVLSIASGLDAVIVDPLDKILMALVPAARALTNQDRFCLDYIKAYNQGRLSF